MGISLMPDMHFRDCWTLEWLVYFRSGTTEFSVSRRLDREHAGLRRGVSLN